ncbi:MAG: molecular chaperone HtpG [Clostridia bacterium]
MATEKLEFQAEVKKMLDIVIHSLYTDKEIFLRELISNSVDALEKYRYLSLTEAIEQEDLPLEIRITANKETGILTISDTGLGMTKEELIKNLGTIAHSGSKTFLQKLSESDSNDVNLIGQFGVGFYSAFMVADKVNLITRSYKGDDSFFWESEGIGTYEISSSDKKTRGTEIKLYLKEEQKKFLDEFDLKRIIKQYSSFVPFDVYVGEEKVNTVQAVWIKNKKEVTEDEYNEFYKFIANDYQDPKYKLHFSTDVPLNIHALLYVPKENMERAGFGMLDPGVNLYCKKILIQEKAPDLLPKWLRFLRGVIDSAELPLNISRETMQDSALISKLRKVITKRFLKYLSEQAKKDEAKYLEFYGKFSSFLKEGAATDYEYKDELMKLLRFESSKAESGKTVSLDDYIERMVPEQKGIYYVSGVSRDAVVASPYMEIFRKKDIEVLYTYETVDDYIFDSLQNYNEKQFISADQEGLELPESEGEVELANAMAPELEESMINWFKKVLGQKVAEVKASKRLSDTPAMVVNPKGMSNGMERMLRMMSEDKGMNTMPKILELNMTHGLILKINSLRVTDEAIASLMAEQLLDNSLLSAGLVADTSAMIDRMYKIMERTN